MADHTRESLEAMDDDELLNAAIEAGIDVHEDGSDTREGVIAALIETPEDKAEREAKAAELQGASSGDGTEVDASNTDLNAKTKTELLDLAREADIKGRSNMSHDELVVALSRATNVATIPPHTWPPREGGVSAEEEGPEDDPALAAGLSALHRAPTRERVHGDFGPEAS